MAVSIQAKRKQTLSYKLSHIGILVFRITLPILLFVSIFLTSSYFSKQNLQLLNEKKFFEKQIVEFQTKIATLNKNIERLMVGSEVIK
ncbi:MAG: hypothetical protein PWP54_337 [Thermosipho sp. (in: thermotogales)]|nr:hypothetical protein [Thermosipho sp. (in: thermotogales)]MDN5324776.1 hypothetical protein [Thermosipho sp. (in: thermotogales)]